MEMNDHVYIDGNHGFNMKCMHLHSIRAKEKNTTDGIPQFAASVPS